MAAWGGSGDSGCRSGRLGWLCRQLGRLPPRPPQASPGLPRPPREHETTPWSWGRVCSSCLGAGLGLLAAPGCSRLLEAAPGCSWLLLDARGCSGGALGLTCGRLSSLLFYPISSLFQSLPRLIWPKWSPNRLKTAKTSRKLQKWAHLRLI